MVYIKLKHCLALLLILGLASSTTLFDFNEIDIDEKQYKFIDDKGKYKAFLVVNVATH